MMHKAWSNIEEVAYCFSRSSIKFQSHTGKKMTDFDPSWAFLDCNSSLNSPMALKWCTKVDVVKKCPFEFQAHLSNFKVTWDKKVTNLNPISVRLLGQSQLSNPLDLPCLSFNILFSHTVDSGYHYLFSKELLRRDMGCLLWVCCLNKVIVFVFHIVQYHVI